MGFPATESSISQIIEKFDSLPNSARDAAVNNSIVPSDNLSGFGESVLKLYNEGNPSAREAIAEMFELVCNEPFDNWLDRVERSCDGFSKQKESVREFDTLPEAIADALDSEGWTVSDDDVRNLGYLEIERETDLTGYDLVLNIDLRGKDMDSTGDWMSAIRELVYSWDPVEEALIAAGCPGAPSVDRIIEDFKSTYESSICGIEAHGMRKPQRKPSIQNRSTKFANEPALPSMDRRMMLARLCAVRISISSQQPTGECCDPIAR